jgi:hypothetical protein
MTTNAFRQLLDLLPQTPLTIATVVSQHADVTCTVDYPGGSQVRVRGDGFATSSKVFVRDGVIEGLAPSLTAITVEV